MTTQTPTRARSLWKDTQASVNKAETRVLGPAQIEQPGQAPQAQVSAEKEADRWVAEMMFENYNP
jgi:hypothetical protein